MLNFCDFFGFTYLPQITTLISHNLSGFTSTVIFSVLNKTPIKVITVDGILAFSVDSQIPHLFKT